MTAPQTRRAASALLVLGTLLLATAGPAAGAGVVDPSAMPGPLKEVRFDQQLGEKLPLDAPFVDELGRDVVLGDYFGERPVVLTFVYYDCPMLCSLVLQGLAKSLAVLRFDVGTEYDVVVISFAPDETPAMAREAEAETIERYGRGGAEGWHFLTGTPESIERATGAAGFRYARIPETGEYAHASGIVVATPDGTIAQYYYGIEYPPKDVRLAVVEASEGEVGTVVDQVLLYCFRYDPKLGKYTAVITRVLRLAGVAFCLGLTLFLWIMWRRDASDEKPSSDATGSSP
jgi:protein SCO1/2